MQTSSKRRPGTPEDPRVAASAGTHTELQRLDSRGSLASSAESMKTMSPLTAGEWHVVAVCLALSMRESQIARLVLDEFSDDEIAERLGISPHTVHAHMSRLYRKIAVHSRYQLIIRLFNAYVSSSPSRKIHSV